MYSSIGNNHQLIKRQQTYDLNRKLLTVHSEDRDIKKWPFSNNFAIQCPESYANVESIRLAEITLPTLKDTFSNEYQNTKLVFSLYPKNPAAAWYTALALNVNGVYTLEIQSGFYQGEQIRFELQNKLNATINSYLSTIGSFPSYNNFIVYYDNVSGNLHFGNIEDEFTFKCNQQITYTLQQCEQVNVFERYTQWGLPWNLGFEKKSYTSVPLLKSNGDPDVIFYYNPTSSPDYLWLAAGTTSASYYLKAPLTAKLFGEIAIYMEIEKFNYLDELTPYSSATNNSYGNDYGGKVNSAFVKIPISSKLNENGLNTTGYYFNGLYDNVNSSGYYFPPMEKFNKLKFRFRYHDGRLVDFKDIPFTFTIELNMIRDEMKREFQVRMPSVMPS
jgi:hypothetical protein